MNKLIDMINEDLGNRDVTAEETRQPRGISTSVQVSKSNDL